MLLWRGQICRVISGQTRSNKARFLIFKCSSIRVLLDAGTVKTRQNNIKGIKCHKKFFKKVYYLGRLPSGFFNFASFFQLFVLIASILPPSDTPARATLQPPPPWQSRPDLSVATLYRHHSPYPQILSTTVILLSENLKYVL